MASEVSRRSLLAALALSPLVSCGSDAKGSADRPTSPSTTGKSRPSSTTDRAAFEALERTFDARLGVYGIDTGSQASVGYRPDERFAYCSTFKALAVGALLRRTTVAQLDEVVGYASSDLVDNSPITSQHVATGMTLHDLCDAAMRVSDNTAANLIVRQLGGPKGLQADLRRMDDDVTRVDRTESALNDAVPGDQRDTTTPRTLATDLRAYVLGNLLAEDRRSLLTGWLTANLTGTTLIRAGVPTGWTVGDKSGTGDYGTRNDVAIVWPPSRRPMAIAVMSTRTTKDATTDDALVAQAAAAAIAALQRGAP